jgi:hypothetical protein
MQIYGSPFFSVNVSNTETELVSALFTSMKEIISQEEIKENRIGESNFSLD